MQLQLPLHLTLSAALCLAMLGNVPHAAAAVPTTTTLAITSGGSAVTTVTSGTVVTLTATVVAGTTPVTPGLVTFCDAAAAHCTDIHIIGTAQLTSAGTATYRFRPGVGSHSYYAVFAGTPNGAAAYAGSASSTVALSGTGLRPSITSITQVPDGSGTYTLTATVGGNGSTAPTGTVSFQDTSRGRAVLGTAPLGAGAAGLSLLNTTSTIGEAPEFSSITEGVFNPEGIPGLAASIDDGGQVEVLAGDGNGDFGLLPYSENYMQLPGAIAAADFNGDGILDFAVVSSQNSIYDFEPSTVSIFLAEGYGNYSPVATTPSVGSQPSAIAAGDFNGDGIPDLAIASYAYDSVTVLLGNGDGTFFPTASSVPVGAEPVSIGVGDFNGDGNLDLVVVNDESNVLTVLLGDGNGNFTAAANPVAGINPQSVTVADFNGDGILDLAVSSGCIDYFSCGSGGAVTILLGNGDGSFSPTAASLTTEGAPVSITTGDFNGDGKPDLAVANEFGGGVSLFLGDGIGNFNAVPVPTGVVNPWQVVSADFNGDGNSDLVLVNGYLNAFEAANVTATATVTGVPNLGSDEIEASYSGDSNYSAGISPATALSATLVNPTVAVSPYPSDITTTQAVTVSVFVNGVAGSPTPTGSVTLSGGYSSGPTTLSNGGAQFVIPAGSLATGGFGITADYTPDASSSGVYASASGYGVVSVSTRLITPTLTATPSSTSVLAFKSFNVNFSVSVPAGDPVPTGQLTLAGGGYPGTYYATPITLSGGTAQISLDGESLNLGSDTITVTYNPDEASATYGYTRAIAAFTVNIIPQLATLTPWAGNLAPNQRFTWNNGIGVTEYDLMVRTVAPTSQLLYNSGITTNTSATVSIPADGEPVTAVLYQLAKGGWWTTKYYFTGPGTAVTATLLPESGTLSPSQTFTWNNGNEASIFRLQLGTMGFDSIDIFHSGVTTATSATVNIPPNGDTVYAVLYQLVEGTTWQSSRYIFTEPGSATPATLTPSSGTLAGSQTFTWNNGVGPTSYKLRLGTSPGTNDIYGSGPTTNTSVTIGIPSNGATLYATLEQLIDGVWQSTPYTFTEP